RTAQNVLRTKRKLPKSVVNNAQVTDHHAIIPTEQPVVLEELNQKEQRIYDLVVKRFLAVLSQPYEFVETKITANIDRETFTAKGKRFPIYIRCNFRFYKFVRLR